MATAVKNQETTRNNPLVKTLEVGTVAGLVGGSVFGVQMLLANPPADDVNSMLVMVGMMVGAPNVVVGFVLHMLISAFIGATFGLVAERLPGSLSLQVGAGALWGILWWVLGALVIMPLVLGMGEMVLVVGDMQLGSLVGHVMFGLVMAVVFVLLRDRA